MAGSAAFLVMRRSASARSTSVWAALTVIPVGAASAPVVWSLGLTFFEEAAEYLSGGRGYCVSARLGLLPLWHARSSQWDASANGLLHECADPCLIGGGQLRECKGGRPHAAVVEIRRVVEAER
jgi:hypothetical protein